MKSYKFYIGTKVGELANTTESANKVFTKEEVVQAIETMWAKYNQWFGEVNGVGPIFGYSVYTIDGYWNGVQETSYVLEVVNEQVMKNFVASELKRLLLQDCIMVTEQEAEVRFL